MRLFRKFDRESCLDDLGPLYHDYGLFGVKNQQLAGVFPLNQASKLPIISAYIQFAIAKTEEGTGDVSFAEWFCADGFYAMLSRHFGANTAFGIDNDREGHFDKAAKIAQRLKIDNITFLKRDLTGTDDVPTTSIVANVGGLYHVTDPRLVVEKSYQAARDYLILQSVVSLADEREEYFESPAPGWDWGCRFSEAYFLRMIRDLGYKVIDYHFNELRGNDRPEDRGSCYFLIKKH